MNTPAACFILSTRRHASEILLALALAWACHDTARAEWTNVTRQVGGEKWGYAGVCLVTAVPGSSAMIAGVSEAGLWRSDDLGQSWRQFAANDAEPIRHRPHQIVFDPVEPARFWVSGCYGPSPFATADGGKTFHRLGKLTHMDGISIDFKDPERRTLVVGLHEQARSVHKSTDGGKTWQNVGDRLPEDSNHSTDPIVIDARTWLVNTAGWAQKKSWGIYRTEDGGSTWTKVSDQGAAGRALVAADGAIYWGICYGNGLVKSADQGRAWQKLSGPAKLGPIQLGPARIAALGGQQVYVSADGGQTWEKLADPMPFKPNGIAYNPTSQSIYAWRSTEKKASDVILRWDLDRQAQDSPKSTNTAQTATARGREVKWNNPGGAKQDGLEHHSLNSTNMGLEMGFNVWVPPAYADRDKRFPVIYFLHGAGGNENSDAGGFSGLVRKAIEEGKTPPVICVFPNGGMSGYMDQPDRNVMMEAFLVTELIPDIDANWRTLATREGRALAGFSMGGGGAMRLAVKYPDLFSAAGSWAAALGSRRPGAAEALLEQLRRNADLIRDRVRLLLIVGDQDMTFAGHGPFLAQLKELKLTCDYQVLAGVGHDLGRYQRDTGARLVEFLGAGFRKPQAR